VGSHGLKPALLQQAWERQGGVGHGLLDPVSGGAGLDARGLALRGLLPGLEGPALLRVITTRQRTVGLWGLGRWEQERPFQRGEERVLARADEQMSVALNSMRLRLVASTDYLTALFIRAHFVEALPITVSLGVAILEPGQQVTREELLRRADQALYQAKRGGAQPDGMLPAGAGGGLGLPGLRASPRPARPGAPPGAAVTPGPGRRPA